MTNGESHLLNHKIHPHRIKNLKRHWLVYLSSGGQDPATEYGQAIDWYANILKQYAPPNITPPYERNFRHASLEEIEKEKMMTNFIIWANKVVKN